MKSFYNFFEQAEQKANEPKQVTDDAFAVFGRHNPPHLGHGLVLDGASKLAEGIGDKAPADQMFYTSRSQDPKKNPLPYELKVDFLKRMFPKHAQKWDTDENTRTILDVATKASERGYKNFHFVGGSDRRQGMEDLLRKYNGDLYNFDNIYSHSAGDRMADEAEKLGAQDTAGLSDKKKEELKKKIFLAKLSASKMRNFANNGDMDNFAQGLPIGKDFTMDDAKRLFDAVRMFGQKNESMAWEVDYRSHKEFIREIYREGELMEEGDIVESLTSGLVGRVHRCGTNHVICVTEDGVMFKNFVHDVQVI
jgi:nicotinic acid mononucleotide adenylyltransferase